MDNSQPDETPTSVFGLPSSLTAHFESWKRRAGVLKIEVYAVYLAYKDPRVPLHARILAACVAGYAFNPIDLIPDPIPILGYLDDLVLVPLGIALAVRMIPPDVMADCRQKSREAMSQGIPVNKIAAAIVIAIWLLLAVVAVRILVGFVLQ